MDDRFEQGLCKVYTAYLCKCMGVFPITNGSMSPAAPSLVVLGENASAISVTLRVGSFSRMVIADERPITPAPTTAMDAIALKQASTPHPLILRNCARPRFHALCRNREELNGVRDWSNMERLAYGSRFETSKRPSCFRLHFKFFLSKLSLFLCLDLWLHIKRHVRFEC